MQSTELIQCGPHAGGTPVHRDTPVVLLRADVGRLPFATGSVAAIHAGAAIHCWPNPQVSLWHDCALNARNSCTMRADEAQLRCCD